MDENSVYKYTLNREKVCGIRESAQLSSPCSVADYIRATGIASEEQEHLITLVLDTKNQIRGYYTVVIGLADQAVAHVREVFRYAIIQNASSIILSHNHPSQNVEPSFDDVRLTASMKDAAKIIDIKLLDHIIVSETSYFSFREKNMI
jgi:DNA repair protein RadC